MRKLPFSRILKLLRMCRTRRKRVVVPPHHHHPASARTSIRHGRHLRAAPPRKGPQTRRNPPAPSKHEHKREHKLKRGSEQTRPRPCAPHRPTLPFKYTVKRLSVAGRTAATAARLEFSSLSMSMSILLQPPVAAQRAALAAGWRGERVRLRRRVPEASASSDGLPTPAPSAVPFPSSLSPATQAHPAWSLSRGSEERPCVPRR